MTWYQHARSYTEAKWSALAPVSRRSVAEALVTITTALTITQRGTPEGKVLRRALLGWAFNPGTRDHLPPAEIAAALDWADRISLPVSAGELRDGAAGAGGLRHHLTGTPAAGATQRRKRSVFYNASATPSSKATSPPTRSTASSGPPPPSTA